MANGKITLIDWESISGVIDDVGSSVEIYTPAYTADMIGDTRVNYLSPPTRETALIRPRTETNIVNEQGLQYQGDALGYFKRDSIIASEAEVWVERPDQQGYIVYFVISVQPSIFEGELKFVKGILQKRRYETVKDVKV